MDEIKKMGEEFGVSAQIKDLSDENERLRKEVMTLKKTLEEYGIEEQAYISDIEYICLKGIESLKYIAEAGLLDVDQSKILDTLHKNLRMARGQLEIKEPKGKKKSVGELLKIAGGIDK